MLYISYFVLKTSACSISECINDLVLQYSKVWWHFHCSLSCAFI